MRVHLQVLHRAIAGFHAWLARGRPRRYRVTPRQNPWVFRRGLLRDVRAELRRADLPSWRPTRGTTR